MARNKENFWGEVPGVDKPKPKPKPKPKKQTTVKKGTDEERAVSLMRSLANRMGTSLDILMDRLEEILFPATMTEEEMTLAKTDRVGAVKKVFNRTKCKLKEAKIVVDDYLRSIKSENDK